MYIRFFPIDLVEKISQMPIVLIPVHFDRDPIDHIPSCQRSVVIRTFITCDFMTGIPATPGKQIPVEVMISLYILLQVCLCCRGGLKYCIVHRYCASLTCIISRVISARTLKMAAFSLCLEFAREVNRLFS